MMKDNYNKLKTWGLSTFRMAMTNSIVVSVSFLVQGIFQILMPENIIRLEAFILSLVIAVYALVSLVLILTKSEKAAKGQEIAGGFVKGYFDKKERTSAAEKAILPEDSAMKEYTQVSDKRKESLEKRMLEKHEKAQSVSRVVMIIFYAVILVLAVFLLIENEVAVHCNHIIVGLILIADGVLSIISVVSAKDKVVFKNYKISIALSVCSVIIGVLYVMASSVTAIVIMRIIGAALIIKSIGELIVAYRNRKLLSPDKDAAAPIDRQDDKNDE